MLKTKKNNGRGFTIIELMIVLAVAGTIITIIFLALPQAQSSLRESKRRSTALRLNSELQAYAEEHQGTYPFKGVPSTPWAGSDTLCVNVEGCSEWYNNYVNGKVDTIDPSTGQPVVIKMSTLFDMPNNPSNDERVWISVGNKCNGQTLDRLEDDSKRGMNSSHFALLIRLERKQEFYCIDSQQLRG